MIVQKMEIKESNEIKEEENEENSQYVSSAVKPNIE